ncbi:hypothetical protein B1A_12525 [mine drainage metagenome]|uniref:Uncharacterized protein n=1 Tax=mine drainage metagenome TaxID=410659 RepID=T1BIR3_9ZZZZ
MGRRKSFEDLSDQPIVTRVPDSSRSRLKELAKDPSRRSLNALMTEIMTFFLLEKPYEKGLKFRIPRFTIRFEKGTPVRTAGCSSTFISVDLKDRMTAEIERLRTEERILVPSRELTFSAIFWWLATVEPEEEESRAYYESLKKVPWRMEEGGGVNP